MEYDNVLFEQPRTRPVSGCTLRRLLDIGWVTKEESERDWSAMDWEALREYDAKSRYPWRPTRVAKPSDEEREEGRWQRANVLGTLGDRTRPASQQRQPARLPHFAPAAESRLATQPIPMENSKKRAHGMDAMDSDETQSGACSPPKRSRSTPNVGQPQHGQLQKTFPVCRQSVTPSPSNSDKKQPLTSELTRTLSQSFIMI
jgi:hypothetical protein